MEKKETILLDARLISVIDNNAFGAELRNRHRFTAFFRRGDARRITPEIGAQVTVEMSPYDMSKGRLVVNQEQ
jgi:translation initiation factor IF-1